MCLFCRRSTLSWPHIFWKPVLVTERPPSCLEMLPGSDPNLLGDWAEPPEFSPFTGGGGIP